MAVTAFFDVDGTITDGHILRPLVRFQLAHLPRLKKIGWLLRFLLKAPLFLWIDKRSRSRFNVIFYRCYAGLESTRVRKFHQRTFEELVRPHIFPDALQCIKNHQAQGHRIVLVTGALDLWTEPLAAFLNVADIMAIRLEENDGRFTGNIDGSPIADEHKATLIHEFADQKDIELKNSYAYGNSMGDSSMLECVGNAIAINPDKRLHRLSIERGWRIEQWRLTGDS